MPLNQTTVTASIIGGESNTFGAVTVPSENFTHTTASASNPLTNGTGSGQANHDVSFTVIAGTGGVAIDLTSLTGDGLDGKTRDFSNGGSGGNIKSVLIENLDASATITVTQVSNGWTGFSGAATGFNKAIDPGGFLLVHQPVNGMTVTSTNKSFTLTGSAGTPQAKITIAGVAA